MIQDEPVSSEEEEVLDSIFFRLLDDPAEIDRIIGDGAARASNIATPILERTYDIVGMIRSR